MGRNMFRRVESCYPVENTELRDRIISDLNLYLQDDAQAWVLESDGTYKRLQPAGKEAAVSAQTALLEQLAEKA